MITEISEFSIDKEAKSKISERASVRDVTKDNERITLGSLNGPSTLKSIQSCRTSPLKQKMLKILQKEVIPQET